MKLRKEVLDDAALRFKDDKGCIVLTRVAPGVLLLTLSGLDKGQFGDAVFAELASDMSRHRLIEVFVDTREAVNADVPVTNQWSDWLQANRKGLKNLNVLVASKFVRLTAEVMKVFSRTGELMRIYSDAPAFSDAIAQASGRPFVLGAPRR
jgi:hypothetical protein